MPRWLPFAPLAAFLLVLLWLGIGLTRDPRQLPSALIDKEAPAFDLPPILDATPGLSTADLQWGGVTVVNFWASWCEPCRQEHQALSAFAGLDGVELVGIAYRDQPEAAAGFLSRHGNPFARTGLDRIGRTGIDWGIYGVPETFILDRAGRIRYRHAGVLDRGEIEKTLLPLIGELGK